MTDNSNYPMGMDGSSGNFDEPTPAEVIDPEADAEIVRDMAVAQALHKAIAAEVKTGNRYNLRGRFDAIMAERYEAARAIGAPPKTLAVEIDGEQVGTYSFTVSKPKAAETRMDWKVADADALFEWALPLGYVKVDMDAVREHFDRTGEMPGGCEPAPVETPAVKGGEIVRTALRIDPAKVAASLGASLGDVARELLEEGGR